MSDACARGSELLRLQTMRPSSARAVEQRDVEVSINISLDIGNQFFEEGEDLHGKAVKEGVNRRCVQHFRLHQIQFGVDGIEYEDQQPDDQRSLEQGEHQPEQAVGPSEGCHAEGFADEFAEEVQDQDSEYHRQRESADIDNFRLDLKVSVQPFGEGGREVKCGPDAHHEGYQRNQLFHQSFAYAGNDCRHETYKEDNV